jgi:hypothetical protein
MSKSWWTGFVAILLLGVGQASGAIFNGVADNQTDSLGYYYAITGGKFVNGQTVNGQKTSGGAMAYALDDSSWGSYPLDQWNKDGWFTQTAGLALTMKNGGATVYDNFNNDAGDFYTTPAGHTSASTPGLYRGYCMSNNYDWIYAGYFKVTETTTITEITGYFDENAGFDADSPFVDYRMNIWSNVDVDKGTYVEKRPTETGGFDGDVLCSDTTTGTFVWGDTGVDRIFGADYGNQHDDILFLTYQLAKPITLEPGEYWFSHDANVVPEPASLMVWSLLGVLGIGVAWRRR